MRLHTPYTVQTRTHRVGPERDPRGNLKESWDPPVPQPVYGWGPPTTTEPKVVSAGPNRITVEVELFVPDSFDSGPQDKVILSGVEYLTIGYPEDYCNGPFGYRPGFVINLKRVEG